MLRHISAKSQRAKSHKDPFKAKTPYGSEVKLFNSERVLSCDAIRCFQSGVIICCAGVLDEEDIGLQDVVRKEYALALKLKKSIGP